MTSEGRSAERAGPAGDGQHAPEPDRSGRSNARALAWFACGLFAVFGVVLARTAWVCDDAFITLRVVDNLVHGYGPRWNVVERVQAFTHPLWFFLLVPSYLATLHNGWLAALAPGALISFITVALLAWRVAPHAGAAVVSLALLVSSRAFIDYSTSGLENPASNLLAVLGTWAATRDDLPMAARLRWLGWCAGLATLNRLDAILLFLPALGWLAWRFGLRSAGRQLVPGFLPLAAWLLFAFVYYGSPWPNTALAKLASGVPSGELMAQGVRYLADSLRRDPITLAAIAAAVASAIGWHRRGPAPFLAAGIALYVVYVVRAGGDFMGGRFLCVPFSASVALLARTVLPAGHAPALALAGFALAAGLVADHPNLTSGPQAGLVRGGLITRDGIADERLFWFPYTGWLNGSPLPRPLPAMSVIGRSRRGGAHVIADGTMMGAFGYYAGPQLYIVDRIALADPLLARLPAVSSDTTYVQQIQRELGGAPTTSLRIGHHVRNVPRGYFRSLLEGRCGIDDPAVNELCVRVWRLSRGSLFSAGRLRDALSLALRPSLQLARVPFQPSPWNEVLEVRPGDPEAAFENADVLIALSRPAEALGVLAGALQAHPNDFNLIVLAARASLMARRADSLALAERAIALEPQAPAGHGYRAEALVGLGRIDDAIRALRVAAGLDPFSAPSTYFEMALILNEAGRSTEAMQWLDLAAERGWFVHRQARDAVRASGATR